MTAVNYAACVLWAAALRDALISVPISIWHIYTPVNASDAQEWLLQRLSGRSKLARLSRLVGNVCWTLLLNTNNWVDILAFCCSDDGSGWAGNTGIIFSENNGKPLRSELPLQIPAQRGSRSALRDRSFISLQSFLPNEFWPNMKAMLMALRLLIGLSRGRVYSLACVGLCVCAEQSSLWTAGFITRKGQMQKQNRAAATTQSICCTLKPIRANTWRNGRRQMQKRPHMVRLCRV